VYLATNVFSLVHPAAATDLLDLAQVVEELGFDEIDLGDHVTIGRPLPGRPMPNPPAAALLEPLVALGAISAVTRRIRLGTGVLILPQRQPALVAKQVATLDRLSNGRLRLAVGVGWQAPEYESLGVPFGERGCRMEEAIELMRLYWSHPSVTFHGRFFHAEAMAVDPPPVQPGGPPVWLGGGSEAALQRVGRLADGWLAVGEDPQSIRDKVSMIARAAQDATRGASACRCCLERAATWTGSRQRHRHSETLASAAHPSTSTSSSLRGLAILTGSARRWRASRSGSTRRRSDW
jgi:probable F420-dependent oxidoreductase